MSAIDRDTARQVLDLPLRNGNDAGASTIRGYLIELLKRVWTENEMFSGKKPFGNGGWYDDLYVPIVEARLVRGVFGEDDDLIDVDVAAADRLILAAIDEMGRVA